ncbi:MAG TPA: hypothetical protein VFG15_03010 [Amycolatopsis sp.]|nr:hypothetical protein [Amycolatopsis sp.]
MATLDPDLTLHPTSHTDTQLPAGTTGQGYITASTRHLRDRLGPSSDEISRDRHTEAWVLHTPGGLARLWSGASSSAPGDQRWLIISATVDVLPRVSKAVHGSTVDFPRGALPHFTESTLHGFGNAYLGYLYRRMKAESARPHMFDRSSPHFLTQQHRPQQINNALLKLAQVLHHYEWAYASDTERTEWAGMQRPAPGTGLPYWKARNRWLYTPIKTRRHPDGGDPDLPAMLRALADTARANRDSLIQAVPELDLALYDEHEHTLRALADIRIPGPDALRFAPV